MTVHVCPPDHSHDDNLTCYTSHACRCTSCRAGSTEYKYWRNHMIRAGRADTPATVIDGRGTRRRLQALHALGYSGTTLAYHLGVDDALVARWARAATVTRQTAARVDALYEQLSGTAPAATIPARRVSVTKARRHAQRNGWVPPLAWDDIDVDEHPADVVVIHRVDVDQVAVDLAVQGLDTILSDAERRLVLERLLDAGYTDVDLIARMAGYHPDHVRRVIRTTQQEEAAA